MKEIFLRDERFLSFSIEEKGKKAELIGKEVRTLDFPEGCLIAMIRRNGEFIIPRGGTTLQAGDQLTVIGEAMDVLALKKQYVRDIR